MSKQLNLRAVNRGGDRWLYQYKRSPMPDVSPNTPVEVAGQYEDRDLSVLKILSRPQNCQSLLAAVQELDWVQGEILMLNVGQEEDRSSGHPVRFIKVAFLSKQEIAA